jgi:hypothetical protein
MHFEIRHLPAALRIGKAQVVQILLCWIVSKVAEVTTGVHKIGLLHEIAHSPNFWHAIVARISCFLVQETQNTNHRSSLKVLNNQNNSRILQIIRPKYPGSAIGAKQKMLVTRSINMVWICR